MLQFVSFRRTGWALGCAALCGPVSSAAQSLPAVTVPATAAAIDAQTRVYDHEDIARYGEDTLADVLRRLPGITISADGRVLLRGMGGGYTQVLLDGRPLAVQGSGPMLDGLGTEVIERIEIVRGASAADGGEGIAGTIRIVTREAHGERIRRAKVETGVSQGGHTQRLGVELGDRFGTVDWLVAGRWLNEDSAVHRHTTSRVTGPDGTLYQTDDTQQRTAAMHRDWVWNGTVSWRPREEDQITLKLLAERGPTARTTTGAIASSGSFNSDFSTTLITDDEPHFWHLEPQLRWQHRLATGGTLHLDFLQSRSAYRDIWASTVFDVAGSPDSSNWQGAAVEQSRRLSWRIEQPVDAQLRWAAGAELRRDRMKEDALSDGDPETSRIARQATAWFGQVHWQPAADWRLESGLRRERQVTTVGDADDPAQRRTGGNLWLPSFNLTWNQNPDRSWYLGVARTYRQPRLSDLSSGGRTTTPNEAYNPDQRGNPALRNERSKGLEIGVTQAHGAANVHGEVPGELRLGLFARDIQDAIVRQLSFSDAGRWVLSPVNIGQNRVRGAEAEWRWDFDRLALDDPWRAPVAVRTDLTLTHSAIASTVPPARLVGQAPVVIGLGFDAGSRRWPTVTWGATLKLESGYEARSTPTGVLRTRALATLDAYALWKVDAQTRLRVRGTQWGQDWRSDLVTLTHASGSRQTDTVRLSRVWTAAVSLERDF